MAQGIIQGLTGVIGDELTELFGFLTTRTTSLSQPDVLIDGAPLNLNYDGAVTLTLTSGTFSTAITAGHTFRVLSGTHAGKKATVLSRDSGTQVTLSAAIPTPSAFTAQTWEIYDAADTFLNVESTLDFQTSGTIVLNGQIYDYTGKTPTSFTGLTYVDNLQATQVGVSEAHKPLTVVSDYSRIRSAIEQYRRSFLVEYATGEDLNILGRNIGMDRPPELEDDDVYRELIKAIAYAPRGTVWAIQLALDVLLGPGNYEIFEDLTLGSINHPCTVYIVPDGDTVNNEDYVGKAFIDNSEIAQLNGAGTSLTLSVANSYNKIQGVKLADDMGPRLVDQGTGASSTTGITITGPAATFSTRIKKGDIFIVKSNPALFGTVLSRDSDTQLTLGATEGLPVIGTDDDGGTGSGFSTQPWQVVRQLANVRYYRPSDSSFIDVPGVVGGNWTYVGGGTETTQVVFGDTESPAYGEYLKLTSTAGIKAAYRKPVRIEPTSYAEFEVMFAVKPSGVSSTDSDLLQITVGMIDGVKAIVLGIDNESSVYNVYFWDPAGSGKLAGAPSFSLNATGAIETPGWVSLKIVKNGRHDVEIYRKAFNPSSGDTDWNRVAFLDYDLLPSATSWVTSAEYAGISGSELVFGCLRTIDMDMYVKYVDWQIENERDYWNHQVTLANGSVATNVLTDAGSTFVSSDEGRFVTIKDFSALNTEDGNPLGVWEITDYNSTSSVDLEGPLKGQGNFTSLNTAVFIASGNSEEFVWPNCLGHKVKVLDGPNQVVPATPYADGYTILDIVDPVTFQSLSANHPVALNRKQNWTSADDIEFTIKSSAVLCDVSDRPLAAFDFTQEDASWRLFPVFGASSAQFEIADASTASGTTLTLRDSISSLANQYMEVLKTTVNSGYLLDETQAVSESTSPGPYDNYPFTLYDGFGFVRGVVSILAAAGVIVNFDSAFKDDAGIHILE